MRSAVGNWATASGIGRSFRPLGLRGPWHAGPAGRVGTLVAAAPPGVDDADGEQYGPCKVADEEAVGSSGLPAFVCRAGLIVGPEDPSGRFDYWVARLAQGGEVLAPGRPDDDVQWVDVRDLAAWLVHASETGLTGTYDGIGAPVPRSQFLAAVAEGVGVTPRLTWVDQDFLAADGCSRGWVSGRCRCGAAAGLRRVHDPRRSPALRTGLLTRPLTDTARDTSGGSGPSPIGCSASGWNPATRQASCVHGTIGTLETNLRGTGARSVPSRDCADARVSVVAAERSQLSGLADGVWVEGPRVRCQCQRYKLAPRESFASFPVQERAFRLRQQADCGHVESTTTSGHPTNVAPCVMRIDF